MANILKITSISPQTGSKYGTRLTITGNGFPASDIVINFGDSLTCNIITNTPNSITCITEEVGSLDVL